MTDGLSAGEPGAADRYLDARGIRVRVRCSGRGRPLLLINGLAGCLEAWDPLARRLGGRRLVMVDHPGTGLSQQLPAPRGMADLAALYLAVLDELGLDTADVLGFSFGGAVAQQLARDAPRRVGRLVLAATGCGWGGVPAEPLAALAAAALPSHPRGGGLPARIVHRGRSGRHPELFGAELAGAGAHQASAAGVAHQALAYLWWSSVPWLRTLTAPTLVLAGDDDPLVPAANSVLLAALIPGARLQVIAGGGHLMLLDQADELAPVIRAFLDEAVHGITQPAA